MLQTIVTRDYDVERGLCVLLDRERECWADYETDPGWWALRLWTRRN
ncbi:unnamed protein product [marine sediment metagenome]|uniref:Uncharacterized protein n=1 Tax=marine sediment metagenome TaxID=412755 RepID=X1VDJ6_9ZZZZ